MKIFCVTCERWIEEDKLEEPFGLSDMEPACPYCQGSDFLDEEIGYDN